MPCGWHGPESGTEIRLRRDLDLVTAMLCAVCTAHPEAVAAHPRLAEWWAEHQRRDAERRAREDEAREEALRAKRRQYERLRAELGLPPSASSGRSAS